MYKITATVNKAGNAPALWTRFSEKKLSKTECEKMLSGKTEAGKSAKQSVVELEHRCAKQWRNTRERDYCR